MLRRLASDAITTFLGESVAYEAAAGPGLQLALSNEPVADMNMLVVGAGADHKHFAAMVKGARRFFLGATPAGIRLYEGLGFRTVCSARVWVSGETHHA